MRHSSSRITRAFRSAGTLAKASASVLALVGAAGQAAMAQDQANAPMAGVPGLAAGRAAADPVARYDGHRVVRVFPRRPAELLAVMGLTEDVWNCEPRPDHVDVRLNPEQFGLFLQLEIPHQVLIADVQTLIDEEARRLGIGAFAGLAPVQPAPVTPDSNVWYEDFKTLAQFEQRITDLVAAHPNVASKAVIGTSIEGKPITRVRVAAPGKSGTLPIVYINGGQHAREWLNHASTMYVMEQLITLYGTNSRITALLDQVEFVFVPIANPDGYEFTWTANNRLWRKNRRLNAGGCYGVDTNRNWDWKWGTAGASSNPCNDTYFGTAAFSEPETKALADDILLVGGGVNGKVRAHIDTHTYGQWILYPWGWTGDPSPDEPLFAQIGAELKAAIGSVNGAVFTAGSSFDLLYQVSGGSKDWAYGVAGALGIVFELRPIGSYGFVAPATEIMPSCLEYTEAILTLGERIANPMLLSLALPVPTSLSTSPTTAGIRVFNAAGQLDPATTRAWIRENPADPFTQVALTNDGNGNYLGGLTADGCSNDVQFYFSATTTTGQTVTLPAGAPAQVYSAVAKASEIALFDDLETNTNWTVGAPGDDATSGLWSRNDPEPTAAQPGDDHTPAPGVNCWVTDYRAGTSVGQYDVDGGTTTLTTMTFDATEDVFDILNDDPHVSYWRWYSNDQGGAPNSDSMPILISADNGSTWAQVELVTENANAWVFKEFRIADFVAPSAQMKLRFQARDLGTGSIVEAAIDDFAFTVKGCPRHPADMNADGVLNIFDYLAFGNFYSAQDPRGDFDKNGVFNIFDYIAFGNAYCCL